MPAWMRWGAKNKILIKNHIYIFLFAKLVVITSIQVLISIEKYINYIYFCVIQIK